MDLDQQLQVLIDNAPQDGTTPYAVAAVAPMLKAIASQLKHREYYILHSLEQEWVLLTLRNQSQPEVEKTVIYAFPTLKDISFSPYSLNDPNLMASPLPIIHILFQMIALNTIDSIIFMETPGDPQSGVELRQEDIQTLLHQQLQERLSPTIPPDLA